MKYYLSAILDIPENKWLEYNLDVKDSYQSIILKKNNNELIAYNNFCPHQGRRLDYVTGQFLLDDKGFLICPAHGAEFNPLNGECTNGPCKGQSLKSIKLVLESDKVYAIFEE